ncbi:MAG: type ISP restriction/modification enzyme [Dietzia psychralcaliphila]
MALLRVRKLPQCVVALAPEGVEVSLGDLADLFDQFVAECRTTLGVSGASSELSVTGKLDNFLTEAFVEGSTHALHLSQQTSTQFGVPDFRVDAPGGLLGWVEFKAVVGKDLRSLKGHDKRQRDLFVSGLHNIILTNGWQWELYQDSKRVKTVTFDPQLFTADTIPMIDSGRIDELRSLLTLFLTFQLGFYETTDKAVSALASRAKALKMALIEVGATGAGAHLNQLRSDFQALLYRNGQPFTWEKFVDSYVQIAAFGALLWRLESGATISLQHQVGLKVGLHPLLSQCLAILWSPQSRIPTLEPLLEELCRTVNLIPLDLFKTGGKSTRRRKYLPDPIVHAYEPFFRKYDQAAREANGVYYTPVEVVQQIVSGTDELLRSSLGKPAGILDDSARFLDPATGTGTFLLGLANEVALEAEKAGLPTDQVVKEVLTERTSAFELFPGPYTIAHQRLEALLSAHGASPTTRLPIYLADTLATPESGELPLSGFGPAGDEILAERERADWVKTGEEILVVLGNPPWERVKKSEGGWDVFAEALMQQVVDATPVDKRADVKSARDLYVAFWAWALWVLRSPDDRRETVQSPIIDAAKNHGIVAFVTNRTWIVGPSLVGLRTLVRRGVKEVWVCDLGGDARGGAGAKSFAGGDSNVFAIQTGAAIVWLVFDREFVGTPAVRYQRITGNKATKLDQLAEPFDASHFVEVAGDNYFLPVNWSARLAEAPSLPDLFSFEPYTGIQSARDTKEYSPWGVDADEVYAETRTRPSALPVRSGALGRWSQLSEAQRRAAWSTAATARSSSKKVPTKESLDPKKVRKALYRPLDFRHVYDDPAWIDWYREDLHRVYEDVDVPTLISLPRDFGAGPLVIHSDLLPEQHSFRGKAGGMAVFPLWLPGDGRPDNGRTVINGRRCGFKDSVLEWAESAFPDSINLAEDTYDYVLALLSAPLYSKRYWPELEAVSPRVPLVEDEEIAREALTLGRLAPLIHGVWEIRFSTDVAS